MARCRVVLLACCGTNVPADTLLVEEVLEQLEAMEAAAHSLVMDPETGAIYSHPEARSLHPDTDASEMRRFAKSQGLNRIETELLLERMAAQGDPAPVQTQETLLAGPEDGAPESVQDSAEQAVAE